MMEVISWLGFGQGIVLTFLLFNRKNNLKANRFLATLTLIISFGFLEFVTEQYIDEPNAQTVLLIWGTSSFLYGPLQYLYVKYLLKGTSTFAAKDFFHFILPLVYLLVVLIQLLLNSPDLDYYLMLAELLVYEILFVQLLSYSFASLRLISRYQKQLVNNVSSMESQQIKWLWILILLLGLVYVSSIAAFHINSFYAANLFIDPYLVTQLLSMCLVYVISYYALSQPALFFRLQKKSPPIQIPLDDQARRSLLDQVKMVMEKEKLFSDPVLTLDRLASALDANKYYLSKVINDDLNLSFYDLVNHYRIEAAARMIRDPSYDKYSIEGISKEAGFRSKTTFNSAFRKILHCTPSEYKKDPERYKLNNPYA